jgi:predicted nucleotidyltransferase
VTTTTSVNLQNIAERLAKATRASAVILFGSHATHTARPDSDVDVLYVVPDDADLLAVAQEAERLFYPRSVPLDLVPMHQSHWQQGASVLARIVKREGIVLYGA